MQGRHKGFEIEQLGFGGPLGWCDHRAVREGAPDLGWAGPDETSRHEEGWWEERQKNGRSCQSRGEARNEKGPDFLNLMTQEAVATLPQTKLPPTDQALGGLKSVAVVS